MRWRLIFAVTAAIVLPLTAAATAHRKPGLWQTTVQTKFTKGGPQIPPDQLAKMQQLGVTKLPGGVDAGPRTGQLCLTPEQAAKDDHPYIDRGHCQLQNQSWSGNTFTAEMTCHSREGDMHGQMQIATSGDTSYSGVTHMEGSDPRLGGDYVIETRISGQWQGGDCGSVKPFTPDPGN